MTLSIIHSNSKHAHIIINNQASKNHTSVLGTRDQKSMIGVVRWEIIECHGSWIDTQVVS